MKDDFKHKGLRAKLVKELAGKGIKDERILDAMNKIPRHLFMDQAFLSFAYVDKAFPIASGQTISQPYTVAFQTQLLNVQAGMKVLEVGTGSGYQTCVLEELGSKVYSIERQKTLFEKAKTFLPALGYRSKLFYGDGYKGLPAFGPFDRILVTAGAPHVPQDLIRQLNNGGIMVIPVGETDTQTMLRLSKDIKGIISEETHGSFKFVPLLEDKEWRQF